MKIRILLLILCLLFISGTAYSLDIWAEFSGPAIWDEGGTPKINPGNEFNISIYAENNDLARLGWSSPFHFYGTDQVTTLAGTLDWVINPAFGDEIWDMGYSIAVESWDGDLTNFECSGGLVGDQFCFSGISMYGWYPDNVPVLAITFTGEISIPSPEPDVDYGTFCVAQGDFCNDTWDWLFDEPVPTFETTCLPVIFGYIPPCGDANGDDIVNLLDITYLISFLYKEGPAPVSIESADVNNSGGVDILDITYLIAFLYKAGPAPQCPYS